ncbi:hypothetical protein VaNZ11_004634 [Volvox africanus]|uniref:CWF21 domain-containing protein n=1 Tax=Volvox africanus TaxID=51714 RepID=A0ABQ5RYF6_9CHLO|nr:hypothetical protein VaNZ11_004634 [Volvox africanus]
MAQRAAQAAQRRTADPSEALLAQLLTQRALLLQERSQSDGVTAFLRRPPVRGRLNERFLQNTLRGVRNANRRADEAEMWELREAQLEREAREAAGAEERGMMTHERPDQQEYDNGYSRGDNGTRKRSRSRSRSRSPYRSRPPKLRSRSRSRSRSGSRSRSAELFPRRRFGEVTRSGNDADAHGRRQASPPRFAYRSLSRSRSRSRSYRGSESPPRPSRNVVQYTSKEIGRADGVKLTGPRAGHAASDGAASQSSSGASTSIGTSTATNDTARSKGRNNDQEDCGAGDYDAGLRDEALLEQSVVTAATGNRIYDGGDDGDGGPYMMTDEEIASMLSRYRVRGRGGVGSKADAVGPDLEDMEVDAGGNETRAQRGPMAPAWLRAAAAAEQTLASLGLPVSTAGPGTVALRALLQQELQRQVRQRDAGPRTGAAAEGRRRTLGKRSGKDSERSKSRSRDKDKGKKKRRKEKSKSKGKGRDKERERDTERMRRRSKERSKIKERKDRKEKSIDPEE